MQITTDQGFIITGDWLDSQGKHFLRFMGTGSMGSFELVISNFKPYFFIDQKTPFDLTKIADQRIHTDLKNFSGSPVDRLEFSTYNALIKCQKLIEQASWNTFEADVKPTERYLMNLGINGSFLLEDFQDSKVISNMIRYLNPTISPSSYKPEFKVLSLDIETSRDDSLLSIGMHTWHTNPDINIQAEKNTVFVRGAVTGEIRSGFQLESFANEKLMLSAFSKTILELDPDIVIGWNVIDFDFSFLAKRYKNYQLPMNFGKLESSIRIGKGGRMGKNIFMHGRQVIDGPNTLRTAFYSFESYKLNDVAEKILGIGKDIQSQPGHSSWDEIERRFRQDTYALAYYNILDCVLVSKIFQKTDLLNLQSTRSCISGLLLGKVGLSTTAFDHFFIPKAHQYGLVAKNVKDVILNEHAAGGHVLEPKVGIFEDVVVLDFKSLYPSIINTFKIDPISLFYNTEKKQSKTTPTHHYFHHNKHALPDFIKELLLKRQAAKTSKDNHLSQSIKILMNSFYGVMGSSGSRFYHPDLPSAITGTGRWILKTTKEFLEYKGYQVIYGDTDSVFVCLQEADKDFPFSSGEALAKDLNQYFRDILWNKFGVISDLEVEFEKYYKKFFLPPSRSKLGGSKKRYAGFLVENENALDKGKMQFVGLEYVRSDWTRAAKKFQFELLRRVFLNLEINEWMRNFVSDLKNGKFNLDLVYQKRLTKPAREYMLNRPPHVKAALLLNSELLMSLGNRPKIDYIACCNKNRTHV